MPEREISKADVERVVLGTDARSPYVGKGGATREFYGALADGRKFYVVTNAEVTQVITILANEDTHEDSVGANCLWRPNRQT
jgi:hypothetical protein